MSISNQRKSILLSSSDVQNLIRHHGIDNIMDKIIQELEKEVCNFDSQIIDSPTRSGFNYDFPNIGLVEWMPLFEKDGNITIKVVGYHPHNPSSYNLPTILSTISQYDTTSGHLLGLIDGVIITALRTGAASAIATKYLSNDSSSTLGLIGCGAQSITQLHAISRIRQIDKVLYYDTDPGTLATFESRAEVLNLSVDFHQMTIKEIVQFSDILCTATSIDVNEGPLFGDVPTQPHLHVNAVGSDFPGKIELPIELMNRAFICADFVEQALKEGECQRLKKDQIDTDLVWLARNSSKYASKKKQLSVFDSTGWALEDHISFNLFFDLAKEIGIGQEVELEFIPEDSKNPYQFVGEQFFAAE